MARFEPLISVVECYTKYDTTNGQLIDSRHNDLIETSNMTDSYVIESVDVVSDIALRVIMLSVFKLTGC